MRLKRVVALLLTAPLLQLNAQRADAACARHHDQNVGAPVDVGEHAHHASPPLPPSPPSASTGTTFPAQEDCETPVSKDCCHALVSCALDVGVRDDGVSDAGSIARNDSVRAVRSEPESRVSTPDPPPPKR